MTSTVGCPATETWGSQSCRLEGPDRTSAGARPRYRLRTRTPFTSPPLPPGTVAKTRTTLEHDRRPLLRPRSSALLRRQHIIPSLSRQPPTALPPPPPPPPHAFTSLPLHHRPPPRSTFPNSLSPPPPPPPPSRSLPSPRLSPRTAAGRNTFLPGSQPRVGTGCSRHRSWALRRGGSRAWRRHGRRGCGCRR